MKINDPYNTMGGAEPAPTRSQRERGQRSKGGSAARAAIAREALSSSSDTREDGIRRIRDDAAALRGSGTGGWSDDDIEDYVSECNRQLKRR